MTRLKVIILTILVAAVLQTAGGALPDEWQRQIDASSEDVGRILDHILTGDGKHQTYDRLALLGDLFGSRMSGSESLENAIDYILNNLTAEGFTNVNGETMLVPRWTRGEEWGVIHIPGLQGAPARNNSMYLMAIGTSVGTGGTMRGQTIVVHSLEELQQKNQTRQAEGKIVVFNQPWENYGQSGAYRRMGAAWAESCGAMAVLVRSVTGRSIYSPHTGVQDVDNGIPQIPAACITVEDAALLQRFQDRGHPLDVSIYMEAENHPWSESRNVVAELVGSEYPDQTVIFGGHIDTWDVTDGSMDDGGGVMLAWEAFSSIKKLGLQPKRTIRLVLWTAEEYGLYGGEEYFRVHQDEVNRTSIIMQADGGTFEPYGIHFSGSGLARSILEEALKPLMEHNASTVINGGGASSDTGEWVNVGVPGVELYNNRANYFDYHHTYGDAMTALNPDHLDLGTAIWATVAYTVANMDDLLPRTGEYVGGSSAIISDVIMMSLSSIFSLVFVLFLRR